MRRLGAALFALAAGFILAVPAWADEWPSRPVRIVNTFAPGGAADILARIVADHLSSAFKQQFYVETRAGAGGVIGVQTVANSEPDGYNFVISTLSLTIIAPFINPKIGYDPMKDLTHVAYIAGTPILFIVSAKSDVKSLKDFVAKSKAGARPLAYGSSGLSSAGQMVAQSFAMNAGLRFEIIPYKGAAPGRQSHRLCHPDRDLGLGSTARRHGHRTRGVRRAAAARLSRSADVQGTRLRRGGDELVRARWAGRPACRHRAQGQPRDQYRDGEAREPTADA
jgi:hypothetical protein